MYHLDVSSGLVFTVDRAHLKKVAHAVSDTCVKDLFSPTDTCGIGFLFARKL